VSGYHALDLNFIEPYLPYACHPPSITQPIDANAAGLGLLELLGRLTTPLYLEGYDISLTPAICQ